MSKKLLKIQIKYNCISIMFKDYSIGYNIHNELSRIITCIPEIGFCKLYHSFSPKYEDVIVLKINSKASVGR